MKTEDLEEIKKVISENTKVIFRNSTNVQFKHLKNVISKDKSRPHLKGVFLDLENDKLVVTNSHVLVAYGIEILQNDGMKGVLIDPKIFNQSTWLSVPKTDLELVEFHVTEKKTEIKLGEDVVATALNLDAESSFPNWKHVFNSNEKSDNFIADIAILKDLILSIPQKFTYPKFEVGRKLTFKSEYEDEDFGNVEIVGLAMTYGFEADQITDEGEEVKIPRDDKGKVFSDFFKKVAGRRLSKRVLNTWLEDFEDEDTGDVVAVERNEIIVDKDTIIDEDVFEIIAKNKNVDYLFIHKYN